MQAIIKYEYLIAPAFGSDDDIMRLASDLEILSEHIQLNRDAPLIEEDTVGRMIDAGFYPSTQLFKERLSKLPNDFPYCAQDIVHMINRIVQRATCSSFISSDIVVEWQDKELEPPFVNVDECRKLELSDMYEKLLISNFFYKTNYSTIYHCRKNTNKFSSISLKGTITEVYPDQEYNLPISVDSNSIIYHHYSSYLSTQSGKNLFDSSDAESIKRALYVGSLNLQKISGGVLFPTPWRDFEIGESFFESLEANECAPGMRYDSVLFDTVVHLLSNSPKYPVNVFTKSEDSDEPRTHGSLIAFRTHITKNVRALRLMFWRSASGHIILANVGNKSELEILPP